MGSTEGPCSKLWHPLTDTYWAAGTGRHLMRRMTISELSWPWCAFCRWDTEAQECQTAELDRGGGRI